MLYFIRTTLPYIQTSAYNHQSSINQFNIKCEKWQSKKSPGRVTWKVKRLCAHGPIYLTPLHPSLKYFLLRWPLRDKCRPWISIHYSVSLKKSPPWNFLTFFPKRLGIFSPNFTCLLYVPVYAGLQIFIQLSATLTKLCHIKRDHHNVIKMSTIDRNARWVIALNMA